MIYHYYQTLYNNGSEMWKFDSLPLICVVMHQDRFKMLLRFIRFDNVNMRNKKTKILFVIFVFVIVRHFLSGIAHRFKVLYSHFK